MYHFSLTKYSATSWTYQSVPHTMYDTVFLNFSLQNIHEPGTSDTCKFTLQNFVWKGRPKVNYYRDSLHALSTYLVMDDSGKVTLMQNMNAIVQDVVDDSGTGKYMSGLVPDQVSNSAITDMLTLIFSVLPAKKVKPGDTWIRNITLATNHPVNFSNFLELKSYNGDTAFIEIQSNIFARRSPGTEFYIKGNQQGEALVDYTTGMPFWYQTKNEIITTTNYYDVKKTENFILKQESF